MTHKVADVIALLEQTIANKQQLLKSFEARDNVAAAVATQFLEINLEELTNILDHLKVCE